MLLRQPLQSYEQRRVKLHRKHGSAAAHEIFGHLAMARAHFNPTIIIWPSRAFHTVWRHANRPRDFLAPARISQEMLSQLLSRHEDWCCQFTKQRGEKQGTETFGTPEGTVRTSDCILGAARDWSQISVVVDKAKDGTLVF